VVEGANQAANENIFTRFRNWYSEKLETHPLITKSITGGLIAASGDIICQYGMYNPAKEKKKMNDGKDRKDHTDPSILTDVFDPMRSVHFYMMGAFFAAPLNHIWFNFLSKIIPGQGVASVTKQVGLDQLIWTPAWTVGWMAIFWSLEGCEPKDIVPGLKENYPGVIKANWLLWIPAQYINFYFTPLKYQVLFTNFVELIWNTYLSFVNRDDEEEETAEQDIPTDGKSEEEREKDRKRHATQTLHRKRTFR